MKLIGIAGAARSGKDTAAQALVNMGWRRHAFADPLKAGARVMLGLTDDHTDGDLKESPLPWLGGVTPRLIMQTLGTEWGRDCVHPELWLRVADNVLAQAFQEGVPGVVIPDVRFDNEAAFIRERGGRLVHLIRPGCDRVRPHLSESGVAVDPADEVVMNVGTAQELQEMIALGAQLMKGAE